MNKIALLFPGQGSQYIGMGKEFCSNYSIAKQRFEEASDTLGFDLMKLCIEGNITELTKTINAQPAILTVSFIAYELFQQEIGAEPVFLVGHSLGEYSALASSGSLTFSDAIKIVRRRGSLMQETLDSEKGAMAAAVGIGHEALSEICIQYSTSTEPVVIACSNSADQNVISGHKNAVNKVLAKLEKMSIRHSILNVSTAFHSPMMEVAAGKLRRELEKYQFHNLKYPVISNATVKSYNTKEDIIHLLELQMTKTVRWFETMNYLIQHGITHAIEVGPNKVLSNLMKSSFPHIQCNSVGNTSDLVNVRSLLKSTLAITCKRNINFLEKYITEAIILKNRNKNYDEFERGVIAPFETLKNIISNSKNDLDTDEFKDAIELVNMILMTKKATDGEQKNILTKLSI